MPLPRQIHRDRGKRQRRPRQPEEDQHPAGLDFLAQQGLQARTTGETRSGTQTRVRRGEAPGQQSVPGARAAAATGTAAAENQVGWWTAEEDSGR